MSFAYLHCNLRRHATAAARCSQVFRLCTRSGSTITDGPPVVRASTRERGEEEDEEDEEEERHRGYRGFGSFHSDNVEELLRLPKERYTPPPLPSDIVKVSRRENRDGNSEHTAPSPFPAFGSAAAKNLFLLDPSWSFLNHGAFGAAFKVAVVEANAWRMHLERQPLRFMDRELLPLLAHSTRQLAEHIGAEPQNLALLVNASSALNAVIRSALNTFQPGDEVLSLSLGYGSVKKMLRQESRRVGAVWREVEVTLPVPSPEAVLAEVEAALLEAEGRVRFAVFDHVTSNTALTLPVKELCALCKVHNVSVLVDGAHALGSLDLDVSSIGADYYVSNCHKWLCCPKGAAMLHVCPDKQASMEPCVISHGFGEGFASSFLWDGARDYGAALVIPTVLAIWGGKACSRSVYLQMKERTADAFGVLQRRWRALPGGTYPPIAPLGMHDAMALVPLPRLLGNDHDDDDLHDDDDIDDDDDDLHDDDDIDDGDACTLGLEADAAAAAAAAAAAVGGGGGGGGMAANGGGGGGGGGAASVASSSSPLPLSLSTVAKELQDALHFGFQVEAPIKAVGDGLYVRVSSHVYTTPGDVDRLAEAIESVYARRRGGRTKGQTRIL